ncbi:MAG: hypothetical protein HKN04_03840 [Rhodothermaceae bacterium]|nr:hypothetical protein [Rhodothermaceae bacterium]
MRVLFILAALGWLGLAAPLAARSGVQPDRPLVRSIAADTLFASVQAGEPLVLSLPETYRGGAAEYRLLRGPALSWLVDRSFFWRTLPAERGLLFVLIERVAPGVQPDTLVLAIELN